MNTERNNPNAKPKQFFQAKKAEGVKKRAVGSVLAEGKACQQKVKTISSPKIWADKQWTVRYGSAGRGRLEGAPRLCRAQDLNRHAMRHTVPSRKNTNAENAKL